jgi:hypothetical protein
VVVLLAQHLVLRIRSMWAQHRSTASAIDAISLSDQSQGEDWCTASIATKRGLFTSGAVTIALKSEQREVVIASARGVGMGCRKRWGRHG